MKSMLGCAALLAAALPLAAGDFGKGDLFGQGGMYTELGTGGGSWPTTGLGVSLNLGHHAAAFAESDYVRANLHEFGVSATGNIYQVGGGARIFIPPHNDRVRLFIPVAGGYLGGNAQATIDYGGSDLAIFRESTHGEFLGGGFGADIVITRRFGLRPEFRYSREFWDSGGDDNALKFTVDVLYRVGTRK